MAQAQGWEGCRASMIHHLLLLWLQLHGLRPFLRVSILFPSGCFFWASVRSLLGSLAPLEANPCPLFLYPGSSFLLLLYPNLHSGDTTIHGLLSYCSSCPFPGSSVCPPGSPSYQRQGSQSDAFISHAVLRDLLFSRNVALLLESLGRKVK